MKLNKLLLLKTLLASFSVHVISCTMPTTTDDIARNLSQVGNGIIGISGKLYEPDGIMPALDAEVIIAQRIAGQETAEVARTVTAADGTFMFESLDTSIQYVINAQRGDSIYAMMDWVSASKLQSTPGIADTLQPPGSITGIIIVPDSLECHLCYAGGSFLLNSTRILNNDDTASTLSKGRQIDIDPTTGRFTINNLAKGVYSINIPLQLYPLPDIGIYEGGIDVRSGEVTDVGTLRINNNPIPVITGIQAEFDTVTRAIKVTWDKPDANLVLGINIKILGSAGNITLNKTPVTENFYLDYGLTNGLYTEETNVLHEDDLFLIFICYDIVAVTHSGNVGQFTGGITSIVNIPSEYIEGLTKEE